MNKVKDKTIGFRLSGKLAFLSPASDQLILDQNYIYEICITPGKDPQGNITHVGREETKSIPVDLPEQIREANYEKIYHLLFQNTLKLIVLSDGHEKMGNRKLLVRFAILSSQSPVNSTLLIEGTFEKTEYKFTLDPYYLTHSEGEIQDKMSKDYTKKPVNLKEIIAMKEEMIRQVLPKLKPNHLKVIIHGDHIVVSQSQSLKDLITHINILASRRSTKPVKTHPPLPLDEEVAFSVNNNPLPKNQDDDRDNPPEESCHAISKRLDQRFFVKGSGTH